MPMLAVSAAELAQIQSDLVSAVCDQSVTIWRDTVTSPTTPDVYGSSSSAPTNTANYTQVGATVCGVGAPNPTHLQNFDFIVGAEKTWQVHFPVSPTWKERDHVVFSDGRIIELHVLLRPRSYEGLQTWLGAEIE